MLKVACEHGELEAHFWIPTPSTALAGLYCRGGRELNRDAVTGIIVRAIYEAPWVVDDGREHQDRYLVANAIVDALARSAVAASLT